MVMTRKDLRPAPPARRIAVVGGGISGLTAAWRAHQADPSAEITVLESSDRFGGCLRGDTVGDLRVDVGAEASLFARPETRELIEELGLDVVHPDPAQSSQLCVDGSMRSMPAGTLMGVPSDPQTLEQVVSAPGIARATREVLTAPQSEDVAIGEFLTARLGDEVVDTVVDPLLGGVYAGRCRELSLEVTVPALLPALHEGTSVLDAVANARAMRGAAQGAARGSNVPGTQSASAPPVFMSLRGGIGVLADTLAATLRSTGVRMRTQASVSAIARREDGWDVSVAVAGPRSASRFAAQTAAGVSVSEQLHVDTLILALPAWAARPLLRDSAAASQETTEAEALERASDVLSTVPYADSVLVTAILELTSELKGSGFLVPATQDTFIKASTYSSNKWPWLQDELPEGHAVVRMSVGRHGDTHWQGMDDSEIIKRALEDWMRLTQRSDHVLHVHVQRWNAALPQLTPGHRTRISQVDALVEQIPGLGLVGSAYDGVGIPVCISRASHEVTRLISCDTAASVPPGQE